MWVGVAEAYGRILLTPLFVTFERTTVVGEKSSAETPLGIGPKCLFWRNVALAYGEDDVFEASPGACF